MKKRYIEFSTIESLLPGHNLLIISDYAKGLLTLIFYRKLLLFKTVRDTVIVDPKAKNLSRYSNSSLVTPNQIEAERSSGILIKTNEDAEKAGQYLLKQGDFASVLITRGAHGMSLVGLDFPPLHLPSNAIEVFDVGG